MIRSEKKLNELRKVFESGNDTNIRERIKSLREEEPFEGSINLLASFYDTATDREMRNLIANFFNDIKERTAVAEIIGALQSPFSAQTMIMLASSCWQSGLDYSESAGDLTTLYLSSDYAVALEYFTILDNCADRIPATERKAIVAKLEKAVEDQQEPISLLTKELISLLK
ncbi:MAG TPA: hypothetical protein PKH02_01150 [Bacteroidales bacterium]|nr:hypothetical protein [Bacteroidales bacterium]HPT12824.1 hypothetical protein [Bacteroidales bacterium]